MDRSLRRSCTAEAISRVLEERRGQSQTEEIQITQRSHCKIRNSHIEGPDLAKNDKTLVSHLEPNLKAYAAFLETSGHQDFLGHRSGTTTEKECILGCWETSNAGKKHPPSHLASRREQREESERTTGAIDLYVQRKSFQIDSVRAKAESSWCQAEGLREQLRSDRLW